MNSSVTQSSNRLEVKHNKFDMHLSVFTKFRLWLINFKVFKFKLDIFLDKNGMDVNDMI